VKDHSPHDLYVVGPFPQNPAARLPGQGKGFGEEGVQGFPLFVAAAELSGDVRKGFGGKGGGPAFFVVNLPYHGEKTLHIPFMLGPKKGLYHCIKHDITVTRSAPDGKQFPLVSLAASGVNPHQTGLFLLRNRLFLLRTNPFLIKNTLFLIRTNPFLIRNTLFLIKNNPFVVKKGRGFTGKPRFVITKGLF
jgi:hypothetical protein